MTRPPSTRRRGSILIVAMWVIIALTGLVLALSYAMRIEAIAGANRLAQAQADAAERGMEQFLISVVDAEVATPGSFQDLSMEARQIGDCQVWVVRPDWDRNPDQLTYGLTDEAGKVDLNSASATTLLNLPGMTQDVADSIVDWRTSGTTPSAQGAKDEYYGTLPEPYLCKKAPYETVEELLLVKGVTKDLLFGFDRNRNGILDAKEQATGGLTSLVDNASTGIFPFVTVYGREATPAASGVMNVSALSSANDRSNLRQRLTSAGVSSVNANKIAQWVVPNNNAPKPTFTNVFDFYFKVNEHEQGLLTIDDLKKVLPRLTAGAGANQARINVNTAPTQVLACLPKLDDSDAATIISHRQSVTSDPTDISWLATVLSKPKATAIGGLVTGKSIVYSGDIVAVSPDGKAFRRCRVVIKGQAATAGKSSQSTIIYRRDLTASGWPLPPEIRSSIRSGQGYEAPLQTSPKGGTSL